jgi:YihY family inner membrane protein
VWKKFGDDQAGNLAALTAYYGFFSLFPLMLAFVTILAMVLHGNADLQARIEGSALANFPVIGTQISRNVHSLRGSGLVLAFGIVLALWSGIGVLKVMQTAMNTVWNVPYVHRPSFFASLARAVVMLFVLGAITLASAAAGAVGAGSGRWWASLLGVVLAFGLNLALFLLAFRILTSEDLGWADVFPGALAGAFAWIVLQALGGYYVGHELNGASDTYGTFAVVIGLLAWIYLVAQVALISAEINAVRKRHLWPRSMIQPPLTPADVEALEFAARQARRRPEERIEVVVEGRPEANDRPPTSDRPPANAGPSGSG